jgi:hypothetical protein
MQERAQIGSNNYFRVCGCVGAYSITQVAEYTNLNQIVIRTCSSALLIGWLARYLPCTVGAISLSKELSNV